jgi:serine/threonine protein kinase
MTKAEQAECFLEFLRRIEQLADQTAVHRKKFEFVLSNIRKFCLAYSGHSDSSPPSEAEAAAARRFSQQLSGIRDIISQYLLQTWALPTIEHPSTVVLDQLKDIFGKIQEAMAILDAAASSDVTVTDGQWLQYHSLDLRAIHASFTQYLGLKGIERQLRKAIETRLASINHWLEASGVDNCASRSFSPIPMNYQSWRVNYSHFEETCAIAQGLSATIYYGRDRRNGAEVAIKKFYFQKLNGSKLQTFQREVAVLATVQHPTLVRLIGATDTPPFCIITEWMPNASLYHDLHHNHRLDGTSKTIAAFDIARGMEYLHACHIVHRDMKSLNVLLDANNRIRICDFGFSRHAGDGQMNQNFGTPHWMAPELMIKHNNYTAKVDVFAFGIVLWELATEQTPYAGLEAPQIIQQVTQKDLRPTFPADMNPGMKDLISQCWDKNPDIRPEFSEIVRRIQSTEAMFNGCNRDALLQYVSEHVTTVEQHSRDVDAMIRQVVAGEIDLKMLVRQLVKKGVPPDRVEQCWTQIGPLLSKFKPEDVAGFAGLFVKTSKLGEAARLLRGLDRRMASSEVMNLFVSEIPTGSEEIDANIVIAACRNGCADLCAVYAINPFDIALALNVVAATGVDPLLQEAVIDRCVQSLGISNPELSLAALRCLLSVGDMKRIPFNILRTMSASADRPLSSCGYVALTILPMNGCFPPPDLFQELLTRIDSDRRAVCPVVAACRDEQLAHAMIDLFEKKPPNDPEYLVKGLAAAARHAALRVRIGNLVRQSGLPGAVPGLQDQVAALLKVLGAAP